MKLAVAALVATYRRPRELQRLLQSLVQEKQGLAAVIVVDNEGSEEVRTRVEKAYPGAHYLNPGSNVGCGGGLKLAGEHALRLPGTNLTHLLILDDDAVLLPGTLATLTAAMEQGRASLAYPLVTDVNGHVGWLPGLKEPLPGVGESFDGSPEKFRARFGDQPRDFIWAQGVCLLVNREAIDYFGLHRDDFWVRGEDLEFSLRFTARSRGLFVPAAIVEHLPPMEESGLSREAEYLKHCALVQNIAFIGLRLPHGQRIARSVAGAARRLVRMWTWRAAPDACRACWRGAIRGEPAGTGSGKTFRARFTALASSP